MNQTVAFFLLLVIKHTRSWHENLIKALVHIFTFSFSFFFLLEIYYILPLVFTVELLHIIKI